MKIRVTLLTENDRPVSALGDNPTEKAKIAWDLIALMLMDMSETSEKCTVEKVEIVEEN